MFERFTEKARGVVVKAQEQAKGLRHGYIGSEHILLGLILQEGLASHVLRERFDLSAQHVVDEIVRIVGTGDKEITEKQLPFTLGAKKILELSLREALGLGHNYIGTVHVLLGLVREEEGVASRILDLKGISSDDVRDAIKGKLKQRESLEDKPPRSALSLSALSLSALIAAAKNKALDEGQLEVAEDLRKIERKLGG